MAAFILINKSHEQALFEKSMKNFVSSMCQGIQFNNFWLNDDNKDGCYCLGCNSIEKAVHIKESLEAYCTDKLPRWRISYITKQHDVRLSLEQYLWVNENTGKPLALGKDVLFPAH
jgi:hypothetical protein